MTDSLPPPGRGLKVGLSICVIAAAMGFLTGTREAPPRRGYREATRTSAVQSAQLAPRQVGMEQERYAARLAQQQAALAGLSIPGRTLLDPVTIDPARYAQEVLERSAGRAYDGAPPTIPHAVEQEGAPACLACHDGGVSIEGKIASPLSHAHYTSCTQCHVTRGGPLPPTEALAPSVSLQSSFQGLASPGKGPRASAGAPPQIPHRTFMRERCAACHGVWAKGVASSHPYRQSCTQCHAPSAAADQMPKSDFLKMER